MSWVLLALLVAGSAAAQQGTTDLRGRVADAQGAVLPGVTVVVKNQETGMFRETTSGADGTFIASGLVPGTYQVSAELQGFRKFERKDLRLEVGKTASIDVVLAVGGLEETVTVSGASPIVDVTSKEIGGNITSETLVKLPSVNGNFVGFVGLLPGIVPSVSTESFGSDSISVNGSDPRNNNYMLDGGNNNDDVIGQRAGTQARTPIEAIQEFQVITGQYDAQYGRTSGAVVNAVTKSGTNQVRGSGFAFLQDGSLTTKDFFAKQKGTPKGDTGYQRWGGTVGGPIVRDKIHYFGSLERFAIDRPNTINIPARPELNGTQITKDRVWNTIIRGDHQVSNNMTYSVRWLRESSPQSNQIIGAVTPAAAREESDVDQTLSFNINNVLSNTKVSTARLTWTRENVAFANACFNGNGRDMTKCPVTLAFQDYTDQQDNTAQARINDGIQFEETLGWFLPGKRGDHDLKLGFQYRYSGASNSNQGNMNGTFAFGRSNAAFNSAIASTYPDRFTIRVGGPSTFYEMAHYVAGFAQDKWRLNKNITVSLGARYDVEIIPIPETDDPLVEKYPTDRNNIAPRLGITYDLNDGKSVIRAGYGRFFEKTSFELIGGLYTQTPFVSSFAATFPVSGPDLGPRNGQFPTDPYLVNGPVINTAQLAKDFPGGQMLRNTGATWDNPDRKTPHTDEVSVGFERQLAADMSVSADYVHSAGREMLMVLNLNPQIRSNTNVNASTLTRVGSATLTAATAELQQNTRLRAVHGQRQPVPEPRRVELRRADAAAEEAVQPQLQLAGVLHVQQGAWQHLGQRRRRQQLPGARRPAPRAERGADRLRDPAQLHGQRHGADPEDGRAQPELGGTGAERHAVLADQRQHRPGPERDPGRAARRRHLQRHRHERLRGEGLRVGAQWRARPGLLQPRHALRLRDQGGRAAARGDLGGRVQPHQPHELRQPHW